MGISSSTYDEILFFIFCSIIILAAIIGASWATFTQPPLIITFPSHSFVSADELLKLLSQEEFFKRGTYDFETDMQDFEEMR